MALPPPLLYDPGRHHHLLAQLASIHAACIINDNQLASFLPNFDRSMDHMKLLAYWQSRSEDVKRGLRFIVLQLTDTEEAEVAGYVCLYMPPSETGPFRGEVEKLMVSPDHRFKGVARRVMGKLESEAVERGRWLMVSDLADVSYSSQV